MGLTQLQRAYKRQLTDLYDADDEDEVTPSRKRQKTTPADGDTRVVVKHRCTGQRVTPTSSQDYYCDSPPANQEAVLPWGPVELLSDSDSESGVDYSILNTPPHYYDDVDEDAIASSPAYEKENDDNFTFSPASPPPLTQSTHEDMTPTPAPTTLYVFPDETVVETADGEHIRIPDQNTKTHPMMITQSTSPIEDPKPSTKTTIEDPKPSTTTTNEDPKPSTSTTEEEEDPRKVCFLAMQTHIAYLIAHQWRKSAPSTVEEVTVDVCRSMAVTVLSAPYQEILMKYVRCAIRQPR